MCEFETDEDQFKTVIKHKIIHVFLYFTNKKTSRISHTCLLNTLQQTVAGSPKFSSLAHAFFILNKSFYCFSGLSDGLRTFGKSRIRSR